MASNGTLQGMARNYRELIQAKEQEGKFLCTGLDPEISKFPKHLQLSDAFEAITRFNRAIIEATFDIVSCFKPNSAFYEQYGSEGIRALKQTIDDIHEIAPACAIILDAKRADIGSTNNGYVKYAFEYLGADAVTVHPYLGEEALSPFLDCSEKGIIVLCRTSNPGAAEFQDLLVDSSPLYTHIARNVYSRWNRNENCSLVVGATYPEALRDIRALCPDIPFLIPGIGAQGGDVGEAVTRGKNSEGKGFILSTGRAILYASQANDFAEAARLSAQRLDDEIRAAL